VIFKKNLLLVSLLLIILTLTSCPTQFAGPMPELAYKNIILIIGDGMGVEQVKAAGYYEHGQEGLLSFEEFPYKTDQTTRSANSSITDSAASATAMATGVKVSNGVLSIEIPGRRFYLNTLLEIAAHEGKATGLVTTTHSVHATPAAFGSHVSNRNSYKSIGYQYMNKSRPDVIFAGGNTNLSAEMALEAGYLVATDKMSLSHLEYAPESKYFGYFGKGHLPYMYDGMGTLPELSDMALKAIELFEESEKSISTTFTKSTRLQKMRKTSIIS